MKPCVRGVQDKHRWHQDTPSAVENSQIPSTVNSGKDQSHSKNPVLHSLLMGMSIGTVYLGDNLAVFRKSKFTCKHLIQSLYSLEFTKREMTFMSYTHKTNNINNNKNKTTTNNKKPKPSIYRSFTCNCRNLDATMMFFRERMVKSVVEDGILFSPKKEWGHSEPEGEVVLGRSMWATKWQNPI